MMKLSADELELLELDQLEFFDYKYGIPKHEELDNEIYYQIYNRSERYIFVYGGRGSGKSFEVHGKCPIVQIATKPFCRCVMVREIYNSIKGSIYQELCDYIESWKLNQFFKILKNPMKITHIESGNFIVFAGMDKPQSIKSIKDATDVFFEEAFQIKSEEGVDIIDKSIRTPKSKDLKLWFSLNPDNTDHFLYSWFFDPDLEKQYAFKRSNCFKLQTTYKDNKFVDETFVQLIEADKTANPDRFQVDGLGNWGKLKEEGLFYLAFDYENSVEAGLKKRIYNKSNPLHITLDFNVYPYVTLIINQLYFDELKQELQVCTIEEICLTEEGKRGKLNETMKAFLNLYFNHFGNVVVYGDRSGHNKKIQGFTDFATVFLHLKPTPSSKFIKGIDQETRKQTKIDPFPEYKKFQCSFKAIDQTIRGANPSLLARKLFFEEIHAGKASILPLSRNFGTISSSGQKRRLSEQYGSIKIVHKIDENCKFTIKDYLSVKEDIVKGGKSDRVKELSHCSDALDYLFTTIFDSEFERKLIDLKK